MTRGRGDRGATAVEYALLAAFCALAIVISVAVFREALDMFFTSMQSDVDTWDD